MKQPEKGGSYVYDPETETLTKAETVKSSVQTAATPDETPTTIPQATGTAKRGK